MSTRKRARVEQSALKRARVELSADELKIGSDDGCGDDRISGLCDEMLHHIFSFLPTRDVVQTCVLSKRWRNLWCSVPWLDFDEDAFLASSSSSSSLHTAGSFSTFVNYAMLLRDGSNIQKLRLSCSSDNSNRVFEYIVTAIRHNLQFLDFKILQHHQPNNVLPPSLFTCESLTSLNLNNIALPSYSSIHLSSLKTMHLISVKFPSKQWTDTLFLKSPILETLTVHNCNIGHLDHFQIFVSQLKNLILTQDVALCSTTRKTSITKISAPNLVSLKLHIDMQPAWYILDDLKSLVEANIHLKKPSNTFISLSFMIGIFSELHTANALTLSGSCLQVIGKELISSVENIKPWLQNLRLRFMKSKEIPFHNLKLLKLKTWFEDVELHAITNILKRSPNIETLVIEYNSESSYEENEIPWGEEKMPSECTLNHLKTIQMHGFRGRKNEVKLLTFLLGNAKFLKKMIVEEAST